MKWKPLDTGCEVEYNIQFLDSKNISLGKVTIMDNIDSFCSNNFISASSVIIWATFNGTEGSDSGSTFLKTVTATTTTTTTIRVTTHAKGDNLFENYLNA